MLLGVVLRGGCDLLHWKARSHDAVLSERGNDELEHGKGDLERGQFRGHVASQSIFEIV